MSSKEVDNEFFIGNLSFILSVVKKKFTCSLSKNVELQRNNYIMYAHKFLNETGYIFEKHNFVIDGVVHSVDICCRDARFNSSYVPVLNQLLLKPLNLFTANRKNITWCCLNKKYYLQFYGKCAMSIPNSLESIIYFDEKSSCDTIHNMINTGYYFHNSCLVKASFYSECNNPNKKTSSCLGFPCS